MATAGQAFENPVTGERMIFNKTAHETNGTLLEIEFFVKSSSGRGLAAHFHPYYAERVEIIAGVAHYKLGQTERPAKAGDVIMLLQGIPHIHPWNTGNDVLHWRKTTQLDKSDEHLLLASAAFFESLYALAQQGKVGKNGMPKNPLQTVMLLQALQPSAYIAGLPIWLQRSLFGVLVAIGRALGYKSSYTAVSTSITPD
jgi:quercetin dioxygenase-like cupin family protein